MRKPIKEIEIEIEIEIEGDDEAHTIMQVAQRLPPHLLRCVKMDTLGTPCG